MDTQVRTPQLVFMQPQRLVVPLFQRPYVWNKESQWQPLWDDVTRVAERLLAAPTDRTNRTSLEQSCCSSCRTLSVPSRCGR
jgi:hypothetical protein